MTELDPERRGETRRLAPDGGATGPRRVEVGHVDRTGHDQIANAGERRLALAGAHRQAGLEPDVAHPSGVVGPATRLLEPADVEVPHEPRELDRLSPVIALVRIHHEDEVAPRRL